MDQDNIIKIYARTDNRIQLKMIPGHFVTSQSHITHYLDLTTMKSRCAEAQRIASADQSRRPFHERTPDHLRHHP